MVRAVCGLQLKDGIRAKDFGLMLGWNEMIHYLAIVDTVR